MIKQHPALRMFSRRLECRFRCARARGAARLAVFAGLAVALFAADVARAVEPERRLLVAADEQNLWLARVDDRGTVLFHRSAAGEFDLGRTIGGNVAALAVAGDADVFAFFQDGGVYECLGDSRDAFPQRNLAGGAAPIDASGASDVVYALLPAAAAAELQWNETRRAPTSQPDRERVAWSALARWDDQAERVVAPLCVARYDRQDWRGVAACPPLPSTEAGSPIRLLVVRDRPNVFFYDQSNSELRAYEWNDQRDTWIGRRVAACERPADFWPMLVGGTPTLIATFHRADGADTLRMFRQLGDAFDEPRSSWRDSELRLSPLDGGAAARTHLHAAGFNQHVVLIVRDDAGESHLQFAGVAGEPTEISVATEQIFSSPAQVQRTQGVFQLVSFLILLAVLIGLFVFRRNSMMTAVIVPPGAALALHTQRLFAWLIDLLPFLLAASWMLDLSFWNAVKELANWGLSPSVDHRPPTSDYILWWVLGCGGHTLYCVTMELVAGCTVGKVFARTFVLSELGSRPRLSQIIVRNALRALELMPQFWVFGLLVLLSRNQQRLGDIFARTYVARRAPRFTIRLEETAADDTQTPASDPADASTPDEIPDDDDELAGDDDARRAND